MTFVATKPSWADWVISICFVFVVSVVVFQSTFLGSLQLLIVSAAMLVSRHIRLHQDKKLFLIISALLGADPKTVSSIPINFLQLDYLPKSSPSVGAVSDAAPHPTVGDAPDHTVTPSVGSGALSSLEDRVSALEADARLVPALISTAINADYLEKLIQMSASGRDNEKKKVP